MLLSNISFGQYVPTGSVIHKLDPRAKLFAMLLIVSAIFPAKNFFQLAFWLCVLALLVRLSKISWRIMLKAAQPVFFLVAFTFVFNLAAAYFTGNFAMSVYRAFFTSIRLVILMMFAILLPLTTAPLELADGLDSLLRPLGAIGFPAHECSMMIGMALRFIPLLMHEADKIMKAQLSRGAKLDQGNLFQRVMAFFPVLIPLFIIIFRRADEIAIAMEARGYDGGEGRTRRKPLIWSTNDTITIVLAGLATAIFFTI
ncbi:MAG: energy-coupling factor transporter transmembrane protein EcfT [Synergistaceae bacterium]|nr:energy-coupling factor transporter transmembrane protein EcfT [Synergistaceae bacterium]